MSMKQEDKKYSDYTKEELQAEFDMETMLMKEAEIEYYRRRADVTELAYYLESV